MKNNENKNEQKKSAVAQAEESILSFWQEHKIFEKSLEKESPKGDFVFYDGPPFATGLPHYGHLLAGTIKDIVPRYKTMQGFRAPRKWGWDCHGLPVENLIEKELGLETKKDIEDYGIEKFNQAARNSVLRYEKEWKRYVPRSGRFVDMDNAYVAMDPEYMESIWWVFGQLHKKGLTKEGFKAMHLCPRCETTLANFEVNQGYKDVTDISVTAKFELKDEPGTYVLAWTTTPWTLPGNVALAVGADIEYVKVLSDGENFIVGKALLEKVFEGKEYEIVSEMKGIDLVNREYVAIFPYYQNDPELEHRINGWKIVAAEFVTTEDGTGIVHIAPAFGTDDMQLGQDHDLPFVQHVSKSGAFRHVFAKTIDDGDFAGMLVKQKGDLMSTDIEIIKRLAHDGKLFSKKKLVHSYPHCWRCDTPLLNYATSSWYVDVPKIKEGLIESNKKVHWVPEHVGQGRFGKWLEGARDWALSRSRFWGTPLPIWYNPVTEENVVMGSYDDLLSYVKKSGNNYFALRHGESESNLTGVINADPATENGITLKGKEQLSLALGDLADKNIDLIVASPLQRTKESAEYIRESLGLAEDALIFDERIAERQPGKEWEGKLWSDFHDEEKKSGNSVYTQKVAEDSESLNDVYTRSMKLMFELEEKYQGKNILIVSHGGPVRSLQFGATKRGLAKHAYDFFYKAPFVKNAEVLKIDFVPFPCNEEMELDIHKPYIDDIHLEQDGVRLERVSEVFDVWFDSACMPYAQQHYPFENKDNFENQFPAQFIAEGLDQTRGWFYVMTVIGNALFGKTPFENVIVNGLILAEDGKKMSKSLKNYPDPYDMFDSVGADAIRFYMTRSPVVRAEEFAFNEKGVREIASKVIGRLRNSFSLYEMYAGEIEHGPSNRSEHKLDHYILCLTEKLRAEVERELDAYRLDSAAHAIFDYIDALSTRYMRWSRDRFKGDDVEDKKNALMTTAFVFEQLLVVVAPFVPFVAEDLWQKMRSLQTDLTESVHLASWPVANEYSEEAYLSLETMEVLQDQITDILRLRTDAKLNVRKPLASATVAMSKSLHQDYVTILMAELNVKDILFGDATSLDTELTPELIAEGDMRELLRSLQSLRKKSGLSPQDKIVLHVQTSNQGQQLMEKFADEIKKTAGITEFNFTHNDGDEIIVGDLVFIVAIEK